MSFNIGKKTEFLHAENARSQTIGTIEKRAGQTVFGLNSSGNPFVTSINYGLFPFQNTQNKGFYRISANENSTLSINVSDNVYISETFRDNLSIFVKDSIRINETLSGTLGNVNFTFGTLSTIYYIDSNSKWIPLTGSGTNITGGTFDYTYAEGCAFLVNQNSPNRYIESDGVTVRTSTYGPGHLYNTPQASRVNFYKNRLYLADFVQSGVRYKTTILRSSYPMGIIALVNNDYNATLPVGTIEVTDIKYFYTDTGANLYEIYRGNTKVAAISVITINQTNIVATFTFGSASALLASDEIWIAGTFSGPKVFRWVNNPTITGRDVKQYDTFKLSGGENNEITMLTNIGNIMLVSNATTMTSWNDYTLENFDSEIGCVSKKGYVKVRGTLYFLHYNGIYATTGSTPLIISNKIEKYITGATKLGKESSAAGRKGQCIFFTLGDVTLYKLDGSFDKLLKDVCVEYNIVQENWYIHTNVKASEFATYIETTNSDRLEFTDTAGNHAVKEFLSGESDDGEVIHFRVDTMKLTTQPTNFEYSSKLIALMTEVERGTAIQLYVNLENNEEYYPIEGTIVKGLSVIKISDKDAFRGKPPVCRLVSLSLRDSSKQICKISRMTLVTLPTTDEDFNND